MLPQRGVPSRMPLRQPSQSLLSSRSVLRSPQGVSSRVSPWASRGPSKSLLSGKSVLGASKKVPPKASTSLFGEKKYFSKLELREKVRKLSPFILKGKTFAKRERERIVEQWFPYQKYGTHITEGKAKRRLRELRRRESKARGVERKTLKWQKKLLEAFTRVRKY